MVFDMFNRTQEILKKSRFMRIKQHLGWPASLFRRGYLSVHATVEKSLTHPCVSFCEEKTCLQSPFQLLLVPGIVQIFTNLFSIFNI